MFPVVSRGRYEDMLDRANRAEKQVDELLDMLENSLSVTHSPVAQQAERPTVTREVEGSTPSGTASINDFELPIDVEEAIRRRAPANSPLEAQFRDDARRMITTMGPDFDPEAFTNTVLKGTRIDGWPL